MYLISALVLGFIIFMIIYARYMNVSGDISRRKMQVDNFRDQVEFRVKRLVIGTRQIHEELALEIERLEELKSELRNIGDVKC
ncbi:hypothetical protein [Desulfovibrio gilichinskyi]|uniref:Uncharacterized protein n=1 Tax=Desulfovibrio gilichinskyi TaxID=1519643 RepID=A0A1X7EN00_9BACT|nr:hypothetical protein [Desulfovibrio gilichinskyi]SMF36845.1 hypothetical protein SAMN06295933_3210 [Desulfovibrio gilichinskyi]